MEKIKTAVINIFVISALISVLTGSVFAENQDVGGGSGTSGVPAQNVGGGQGTPTQNIGGGPAKSGVSENINLKSPFAFSTVQQLVDKLLDIVIKVGTVLALFFLIYAGFLYVTAAGNETKVKAAHTTFITTLIGVAIIIGAKAISALLEGTVTNIIK